MRKQSAKLAIAALAVCAFSAGVGRAQTSDAEKPVSPEPAVPPAQQPPSPYDPAYEDTSEEEEKPRKPRWYGWQTLATDGAALTALVLSASTDQDGSALLGLGLAAYVLGGPIVHMAHDRAGVGAGSLGMRIGAPLLGGAIGSKAANCRDETDRGIFCGIGEIAVGILIGAGTAIAIDAAVLAREPAPDSTRPRIVPGLALTPERRALVLNGTF
jgi:hypothetical protein